MKKNRFVFDKLSTFLVSILTVLLLTSASLPSKPAPVDNLQPPTSTGKTRAISAIKISCEARTSAHAKTRRQPASRSAVDHTNSESPAMDAIMVVVMIILSVCIYSKLLWVLLAIVVLGAAFGAGVLYSEFFMR